MIQLELSAEDASRLVLHQVCACQTYGVGTHDIETTPTVFRMYVEPLYVSIKQSQYTHCPLG